MSRAPFSNDFDTIEEEIERVTGEKLDESPAKHVRPFDGICPFCCESDFDLIGLKIHFERGWCENYNNTPLS